MIIEKHVQRIQPADSQQYRKKRQYKLPDCISLSLATTAWLALTDNTEVHLRMMNEKHFYG